MSTPGDRYSGAAPEMAVGGNPEAPAAESGQDIGILPGERGIPSVNRVRSMQSRVTALLSIGCLGLLALGFLAWYYSNALTRQQRVRQAIETKAQQRAQGEMALPPLGRVQPPRVVSSEPQSQSADVDRALETLLGPPPELPPDFYAAGRRGTVSTPHAYIDRAHQAKAKSPEQLALERRLGGAVASSQSSSTAVNASQSAQPRTDPAISTVTNAGSAFENNGTPMEAFAGDGSEMRSASSTESTDDLRALMQAEPTAAVAARVLPTQRFLLPKGSFLDCTLETAIDSTLPGLVTCITATDTFGVDGTTVLLERGSKLIGETRGQVRQGAARVFVLWTEVRTPTGVVVALDSPGTDELGRSGLPGVVDRHFFDRFGAAMLISVLDSAAQGIANRAGGGNTIVLNPSDSQEILTEVLRSTVNIPPTVRKHQGDRIQVLVARDVDFRSVYELRTAAASP